MSDSFRFSAIAVAALLLVALGRSRAEDSVAAPRFVATLMSGGDSGSKPAELSVVFFGQEPAADKAGAVLRECLEAAGALEGGSDIVARAWYSPSSDRAGRQPIALENQTSGLVYRAAEQSIRAMADVEVDGSAADGAAGSEAGGPDAILGDAEVADACKDVPADRLAELVGVAIASRGDRRSQIVRGVRTWCKGNGVDLSRTMSLCVVAISKAAHQEPEEETLTVSDVAASTLRGAEEYASASCGKCHLATGRGGQRAPDLTDDAWEHCDGSVDGIRGVLVVGVPQSSFKDPNRPFEMNPVTGLSKEALIDLAVYVKSLSTK